MSTDANEALIRRFLEGIDQGNIDIIDEVFAPDCVWHMPKAISPNPLTIDEYKEFAGGVTTSLSQMHHDIDDFVAQGDMIVWRNTVHAKHTGDFQGSPPTGKSVSFGGIGIARVRDGHVVEMWVEADFLGLMQQVGAVSVPAVTS